MNQYIYLEILGLIEILGPNIDSIFGHGKNEVQVFDPDLSQGTSNTFELEEGVIDYNRLSSSQLAAVVAAMERGVDLDTIEKQFRDDGYNVKLT